MLLLLFRVEGNNFFSSVSIQATTAATGRAVDGEVEGLVAVEGVAGSSGGEFAASSGDGIESGAVAGGTATATTTTRLSTGSSARISARQVARRSTRSSARIGTRSSAWSIREGSVRERRSKIGNSSQLNGSRGTLRNGGTSISGTINIARDKQGLSVSSGNVTGEEAAGTGKSDLDLGVAFTDVVVDLDGDEVTSRDGGSGGGLDPSETVYSGSQEGKQSDSGEDLHFMLKMG